MSRFDSPHFFLVLAALLVTPFGWAGSAAAHTPPDSDQLAELASAADADDRFRRMARFQTHRVRRRAGTACPLQGEIARGGT